MPSPLVELYAPRQTAEGWSAAARINTSYGPIDIVARAPEALVAAALAKVQAWRGAIAIHQAPAALPAVSGADAVSGWESVEDGLSEVMASPLTGVLVMALVALVPVASAFTSVALGATLSGARELLTRAESEDAFEAQAAADEIAELGAEDYVRSLSDAASVLAESLPDGATALEEAERAGNHLGLALDLVSAALSGDQDSADRMGAIVTRARQGFGSAISAASALGVAYACYVPEAAEAWGLTTNALGCSCCNGGSCSSCGVGAAAVERLSAERLVSIGRALQRRRRWMRK